MLTATGIKPVVTLDLPVTQEYLVKPGDAVSVVLPDGTSHGGRAGGVGGQRGDLPGGWRHRHRHRRQHGGTGGGGRPVALLVHWQQRRWRQQLLPTVTVTIAPGPHPAGTALDQAPVNVNITSQRASNVLAVPVNALLALSGGGFGVQVVTGHSSHLVGVTTGLYGNTMVQVSGPGLTAGTRVEVPSS